MLAHLSIKNYALIQSLEVDFQTGMTVITGETGSGKSVILGALGLLSGDRADSSMIRQNADKCVLEATFNMDGYPLEAFFLEQDLDHQSATTIRREITRNGKSRSFVNDTPVTLQTLSQITGKLIDIHSQHETLALGNRQYQTAVLDAHAGNTVLLGQYSKMWQELKASRSKLDAIVARSVQMKAEADFHLYLLNELDEARIESGEKQRLEDEIKEIQHAEDIKTAIYQATEVIDGEGEPISDRIKQIIQILTRQEANQAGLPGLNDRLRQLYSELQDISFELNQIQDNIAVGQDRQTEIEARLELLYKLEHKHHVTNSDDLLAIAEQLRNKLQATTNVEEEIRVLRAEIDAKTIALKAIASKLSATRKKSAPVLSKEIGATLKQLGMTAAKVDIDLIELDEPGPLGSEQIDLLFSANKGSQPESVSKVASGGELSRLMLAIKSITAKCQTLPTLIFDEIDTGVSGEIADRMGKLMHEISNNSQVITITHLPQIAGRGKDHLEVYKQIEKTKTETCIRRLDREARVVELAKMLSGDKVTPAAMTNARELLLN